MRTPGHGINKSIPPRPGAGGITKDIVNQKQYRSGSTTQDIPLERLLSVVLFLQRLLLCGRDRRLHWICEIISCDSSRPVGAGSLMMVFAPGVRKRRSPLLSSSGSFGAVAGPPEGGTRKNVQTPACPGGGTEIVAPGKPKA